MARRVIRIESNSMTHSLFAVGRNSMKVDVWDCGMRRLKQV